MKHTFALIIKYTALISILILNIIIYRSSVQTRLVSLENTNKIAALYHDNVMFFVILEESKKADSVKIELLKRNNEILNCNYKLLQENNRLLKEIRNDTKD